MNRTPKRDCRWSITRCVADGVVSAAVLTAVSLVCLPGCASSPRESSSAGTSAGSTPSRETRTPEETIRQVEQRYVVGPMAAREMGYQVHWQSSEAGENLKIFKASGDSVFALDDQNFLARLDRETGRRIWRVPVAEPVQEIIGVNYIGETIYLTGGGRLLELDAATGTQTGVQRLEKIANTAPVHSGQFLIYGGRNGQLIWHSHEVAFQWRAYQISPSINIQPILVRDDPYEAGHLVAVGNDGRVAVLHAGTAEMLWDKQLLSTVRARPATGRGAVFVAGMDQHLWAYDLYSGRSIWRYLTTTPLTQSPVFVDDRVYQQIETEGLVCFEATPLDAPGGEVHWKAESIRGNVRAKRGDRLFVWDKANRQMSILDAARGGIIQQLELTQAAEIAAIDIGGEELYAIGDDGRIVRLQARN